MAGSALPCDLDGESPGKFLDHFVECSYRRVIVSNENPKAEGRLDLGDAEGQKNADSQQYRESQSWSVEGKIREVMHRGSVPTGFLVFRFWPKRNFVFTDHSIDGPSATIESPGCKRDISAGFSKGPSQISELAFSAQFSVARNAFRIFLDYGRESLSSYLLARGEVRRALDQLFNFAALARPLAFGDKAQRCGREA
jgi:hypothetical protein